MLSTAVLTPLVVDVGKSVGVGNIRQWSSGRFGRSGSNLDTYFSMLRQPWIAAAAEVRILLILSYIQDYHHENRAIEAEISQQLRELPGAFRSYLGQAMSCTFCGFSVLEKWYKIEGKKASIAGLKWVDPRYIQFEAGKDKLIYKFKKDKLDITLNNPLHFKSQGYFNPGDSPFGCAAMERALPFWEQYKLVMVAMAIAAQRQATPLLLGKTAGGQAAADRLLEKLELARNSGVLVVDALDEVLAIAQECDGLFFTVMLRVIRQGILMSFCIPETIIGQGESGAGDSNLNKGHSTILRMSARAQAQIFTEELIEGLVRPAIEYNYGAIGDWGSFPLYRDEPENVNGLIRELLRSFEQGVAVDRIESRIIELAGL